MDKGRINRKTKRTHFPVFTIDGNSSIKFPIKEQHPGNLISVKTTPLPGVVVRNPLITLPLIKYVLFNFFTQVDITAVISLSPLKYVTEF